MKTSDEIRELDHAVNTSTREGEIRRTVLTVVYDQTRAFEIAKKQMQEAIERAESMLNKAKRDLEDGNVPNTCGVLQSAATDVEVATGRLDAAFHAAYRLQKAVL